MRREVTTMQPRPWRRAWQRPACSTMSGAAMALAVAFPVLAQSLGDAPPALDVAMRSFDAERGMLRDAASRLCAPVALSANEAQARLPDAWFLGESRADGRGGAVRLSRQFALPGGLELRTERVDLGGSLRRFTVELWEADGAGEPSLPLLQAVAGPDCRIVAGALIRRADGAPLVELDRLASGLDTAIRTETLQAPWPEGADPGGPRVMLIDSGLAYDRAPFAAHLARDGNGQPLGRDLWDLDPWPYDADVSRGAFTPIRHGSAVASVLIAEAPGVALLPVRYPRPDMSRLAEAVSLAADAGARVLAMPLGSRKAEDWAAFAEAMRARPELLAIVSAGNNGRDVDAAPLWPGALDLPNMIVVTSGNADGTLAPGANWGAESVDLIVPAEGVPTIDHRGEPSTGSGSSFAVPRVAAMAARLLAAEPDLTADGLRERIFERARTAPQPGRVTVGWIADPLVE